MMTRQKMFGVLRTGLAGMSLCLAGFISSALAAEPSTQRFSYEVYAGGIHAVEADVLMDVTSKGRYSLVLSAKTRGLLGKLAPWHGTFETHGWAEKNGVRKPEQHKSTTTWRDEQEIKDYAYARDGSFKSLTIDEHDKPARMEDIDKTLTAGTIDALTAALLVFEAYEEAQACTGESKVFDGKRSFIQRFSDQGSAVLEASKYNIYGGEAAKCTVEVIPLEGKWYANPRGWLSIQEQGREKGTMPTLWLASLSEGAPAIPVKIMVKTDYGTLMMHLVDHQTGDAVILAERDGE